MQPVNSPHIIFLYVSEVYVAGLWSSSYLESLLRITQRAAVIVVVVNVNFALSPKPIGFTTSMHIGSFARKSYTKHEFKSAQS